MTENVWNEVDHYLNELFVGSDPALDAALRDSETAGLPPINVAPNHGKFLNILARTVGARTILEIGTLGGYSTIWLARALPEGGKLISLEAEPKHAEIARANIARAALSGKIEIRPGKAADTLNQLLTESREPFDFIFIDADKPSYCEYLQLSLKLSRVGTLIFADNVVRKGAVADPSNHEALVAGARRFNQMLAAEPRVSATAIQTVGSKGYDGFAIALVTSLT
ncbi:MAG: O-methyltransferase [Chthoniobacterales bacterium]